MKKMKKALLLMLATALLTPNASAQENVLNCAAQRIETADFERYPSHTYDENTGKWSVRANQGDALLDRFWTYAKANAAALCAFTLEIEGNAHTGVWTPVLQFYYADGKAIDATAVSILVGEERYDLAAISGTASNGSASAELISAPLNREGLKAVQAMIAGEEVSVRLIGDRIYTMELDRDTTNPRRRIEAAALNALEPAMALLQEAGVEEYGLWDLSAGAWESEYGFEPACTASVVVGSIGGTSVKDDFGMVMRGDQNAAAKAAQRVLIESGFMSGSTSTIFTQDAANAARRAQHYLGMIETGCMDAQLEQALAAGPIKAEQSSAELVALGGAAEISLERYWFADGVSAANAVDGVRMTFNGDNAFLIADGMIRNISPEELSLFYDLKATVVYGDSHAYEATIVCERNEGSELEMTMLPMAQSRLIVYAEVPAYLAQTDAEWRIELSAGDAKLNFELQ